MLQACFNPAACWEEVCDSVRFIYRVDFVGQGAIQVADGTVEELAT